MAKKNKGNWGQLQERTTNDQMEYRDVYEDQQLERSSIQEKQTATGRIVFSVIMSLLAVMLAWVVVSAGCLFMDAVGGMMPSSGSGTAQTATLSSDELAAKYGITDPDAKVSIHVTHEYVLTVHTGAKYAYYQITDPVAGSIDTSTVYRDAEEVPEPEWVSAQSEESTESTEVAESEPNAFVTELATFRLIKLLISLVAGLITFAALYTVMMRNLAAQNMMNDTSDINQYHNDQHIALPEEVMRKFDWFPDAGAHTNVQPSSMISHVMLQNKGINPVMVAKRAKEDIKDEDGDIEYLEGEIIRDDDDNAVMERKPMFDKDFAEALFDASGLPDEKRLRKYYDATQIPYNPDNGNRDKQKGFDTVADLINGDWVIPEYETQRPAGAYLVDIDPVNTMVLAITRAGKGQTVIEPTIDMWTRERKSNNIVINDPKGELLKKFYVPATYRNFQVVQFNLINAMNTDIYNPLTLAYQAAREGDFTKMTMYVGNIADVFFPLDGGDDPVWPNAANNAFKRAVYGLIDYYLEEEAELRLLAERTHMDAKTLEVKLDQMWGKVTLYNCYQLFVQLTAKKLKNPALEFTKKAKAGEFDSLSDDEYEQKLQEATAQSKLWEDKPEADLLTLYFNATDALPKNQMRTHVSNANNALRSMAGAEKMMASVYGIAITAMSFFTDPTISTLTSGTPSQNIDLAGLSFPRRLGFRLNPDYVSRYHLTGMQCAWQAYEDKDFTKSMGKDFYHEDLITRAGWSRFYFKGIFPKDVAYLKCEIRNIQTLQLMKTFYFKFQKTYATTLDGRSYMKDPVLGTKIVKDGLMTELRPVTKDGKTAYKPGNVTFKAEKMKDIAANAHKETIQMRAITQFMLKYAEKQKIVFLVTPPHLMSYAKLILILIKQLVDLNFDQSYMTKDNQKPLYKTRYMLDELGNLQSEGHGISGFETMLSIGLGQEQQFTLILQTLQQLRDVYGDSVDKIVQGNTSNIVFLKSTDDSMLDTLQKMSGTTHRAFTNSKTITRDTEAVFQQLSGNEGKTSYTMTVQEVPVISYNDMAFIAQRNSIIFRAGDSPIWNRNETILPMSWRLRANDITQPGREYTFQTIPTLSSAKEFDVRKNQPDFGKMLDKRMAQALAVESATEAFMSIYDYTEYQVEQLDPDVYSAEIMEVVNTSLQESSGDIDNMDDMLEYLDFDDMESFSSGAEENKEQAIATAEQARLQQDWNEMRYARGFCSKASLMSIAGQPNHNLDGDIIAAYNECKGDMWNDSRYFSVRNGSLYSADGKPYIVLASASDSLAELNEAARDPESRVYAEGDIKASGVGNTLEVTDEFLRFLTSMNSWTFANGRFDAAMARRLFDE